MSLAEMRTRLVPGDGIVARTSSSLLVIAPSGEEEGASPLLDLVAKAEAEGATGRAMARRLAQHVTDARYDDHPGFALLADDPEGIVFVVKGGMVVTARGDEGERRLSGLDSITFLDGFLGESHEISILPVGAEPPERVWDLIEGVVPGSGATLVSADADDTGEVEELATPSGVEEEAEKDSEKEAEEVMEEPAEREEVKPFQTIDLSDIDLSDVEPLEVAKGSRETATRPEPDSPPEAGVELIAGVRCKAGHFNHPNARFCAHCGIGMVHLTKQTVYDARPPLGIVVFGDGSTYILDVDYVVGRDPSIDPTVRSGEARPIKLEDDGRISRAHMVLRREGWEVYLIDRSANGTELSSGGAWKRVVKGEPNRLEPGAEVRFGEYTFSYDSHHRVGT